jgi:protein-tyrosine phosphatase
MEHISIVDDSIYFGKYPDESILQTLSNLKITTILDLTHFFENLPSYKVPDNMKRIHFEIVDRGVEDDEKVKEIIDSIISTQSFPIYIHCKRGHGRSGTIAAILYGKMNNKTADESIDYIKKCHEKRTVVSKRVRQLNTPMNEAQKEQIYRLTL